MRSAGRGGGYRRRSTACPLETIRGTTERSGYCPDTVS